MMPRFLQKEIPVATLPNPGAATQWNATLPNPGTAAHQRNAEIDAVEEGIRELVKQRPKRDPLAPEAAELMSEGMLKAENMLSQSALDAARQYREEAEALEKRVQEWTEVLKQQARETAEHIARCHAEFRQKATALKAIIEPEVISPEMPAFLPRREE
jgi:hypothetical protein